MKALFGSILMSIGGDKYRAEVFQRVVAKARMKGSTEEAATKAATIVFRSRGYLPNGKRAY